MGNIQKKMENNLFTHGEKELISYDNPVRQIIHGDLDCFFVSVERLQNSALEGKPVIVGGSGDRAVVASCSYEARKFGVHSAMPMRLARQLCPEAIVVRGDFDQYSKYSNIVTDILAEYVPLFEKASIDEHYLDITGMDKFFGCWKWAQELRQKVIKETGLPISFGLSINKTVSKIATGEAKPSGEKLVPYGSEKEFLAPLSVRRLPSVGEQSYRLLRNMGVATIGTLQQMDALALRRVLGALGVSIWNKANGIDLSPVVSFREQKSMSKETTFETDTTDLDKLRMVLISMVEDLAFDLRKMHKLTGCITVKIRYANFDTHSKQVSIPYTSSDNKILQVVTELFKKLYNRRMLIRLVGIKFSHLILGGLQTDLFNNTEEELKLIQAIDKMKMRFGDKVITKGVCL